MSKRAARVGDHGTTSTLVSTATQPFAAVGGEAGGTEGSLFGRSRQPRNPISHAQIEIALSRSVAGVAVIFAVQTLPLMLEQLSTRKTEAAIPLAGLLGLSILVFVVATLLRRGIRTSAAVVSGIYLLALLVWPLVMIDPTLVLESKPWLWYLCTVATSCAAIAFPLFWAAVYTVVTPVAFGLVRLLPSGGEAESLLAVLDTCYAMLLGGVVLIIIYVLREATAKVDTAQSNALSKYAVAVRHHATEVERVEVDSIVHDSVLATLLSAAGVRNEKGAELAAAMARSAIIRLQEASGERNLDDASVAVSKLVARLRTAAIETGVFTVTEQCVDAISIPEHAAEALYSASVQAMVNSVQHAGPAQSRRLIIGGNDQNGCTISISDTGRGFDVASVDSARLGLRVSIHDRVLSAGGVAVLRTSPGLGTTITITWPRPDDEGAALNVNSPDGGIRS
ncbi:sensor histidine kinase [Cryobacterium luteum]|uniref:ATP-binding protein n=1 Tax=Cryobacterium luteum TaxID=1424661 RepID=A0A1H8CH23_9MICO|nr:ATP-binding protein [Cryobacterium luteum]TFB89374.1 ATP-binding protein [Cryobacterium luteum]SEM94383.1 Signal transduction histidine kinase [Cryobacterium luteum]